MAGRAARRWGVAALAAGLLAMLWAGVRAGGLRPDWFDPGDGPPCARRPVGCPADVDAILTSLWWVVAGGGAVALAGLALVVVGLPAARRAAPSAVHPLVRAVVVGVVGGAVALPLFMAAFVGVLSGAHLGVAALAIAWLVQTTVVAALDLALGGTGPRRAAVTGLVITLLAGIGTVAVVSRGWPAPLGWGLVDGVLLAVLHALAGTVTPRRAAGSRAPELPLGR